MEIKGSAPGFSAYLSRFTDPRRSGLRHPARQQAELDLTNLARDIADSYKRGLGAGLPENIVAQESKWTSTRRWRGSSWR